MEDFSEQDHSSDLRETLADQRDQNLPPSDSKEELQAMHARLREENLRTLRELKTKEGLKLTGDEIKGMRLKRNNKTGKAEIAFGNPPLLKPS